METTKIDKIKVRIFLACYIFIFILIGLIIFGITILVLKYLSPYVGGIIIGVSLFFIFILFVNPTLFILNNPNLKQEFKNIFIKEKKVNNDQ